MKVQNYDQFSYGGRISIPLNWVRDNYNTSFSTFGGYIHRNLDDIKFGDTAQPENAFGTIQMGLNVSNLRRTALQNLGPKWGQTFNILYQQTTDNSKDRQIRLGATAYFPALFPNHSFKLGFAYQKELLKNVYQFSDVFEYPRGFGNILNDEFLKLSVDYALPLVYPDWGFAGITYFKRISLNLFFDYGKKQVDFVDLKENHNSVGAELIFDNTFWNELPVTFGLRNSYLLTEDSKQYQFEVFVKNFIVE